MKARLTNRLYQLAYKGHTPTGRQRFADGDTSGIISHFQLQFKNKFGVLAIADISGFHILIIFVTIKSKTGHNKPVW